VRVPARLRLAVLAVASMVLVAALAIVVFAQPSNPTADERGFAGAIRPPIPPRAWTLTDQDGRLVRVGAPSSQPSVVTFLYTHCQDSCPVTASTVRGAMDQLGHDVPAYAVSVDPANDTPNSARAFLSRNHLTGRMHFLLGPDAELQQVWNAFGIQPQQRDSEHTAYVVLLDPTGRQRIGFPFDKLTPEGVAHDLRRLSQTGTHV
jgi:protein SCO1/2